MELNQCHDINVVIVNHKMKDQVDKCLSSLFKDIQNSNLKVHVTVVDNGSGERMQDLLKDEYINIRYILHKNNLGFGKAQNTGLRATPAKYHFVLNPDTVVPDGQNLLKKLYDFMEANPEVGLAGPKILYMDGSRQNSCFRFPRFLQPIYSRTRLGQIGAGKRTADHYFMRDFDHDETIPVDWVMGAAMFVRQKAIDKVGLFDERFWMYAEDSDWCRRMWEDGWPVYFVHDAIIQHAHGRGSAKSKGIIKALFTNKLARSHIKSWLKYMWKWRSTNKYYV
ncbi:MAG: hypothetical protein COU31_02075 [Candidatus Magasanikbacteria bacterium CG10_big_fil_rev_8_21_14_0_10_40_10]|uniref:Glycosyltransferase 2-like domain-containing protein n=1 Tax=Candidatus Magasanikbacteria bacterium CG10_big_fil_rev_8_21_14_0_10_40_10 TaxID=1974648 RepID=A0A2M6W4E8_9BACT|nr:MAG: hypothetical protein COU31_02075 [Candidatus Magasanikbacteria bacterium CG10_big_fil_rev_8_21_14_0_10_40_10]